MILYPSSIAISDPPKDDIDIWPETDLYLRARWLGGKSAKSLPDRIAASRAKYSSSLLRPISPKLSEDPACRQKSRCLLALQILLPKIPALWIMHQRSGGFCLRPTRPGRYN